MNGTPEQGELPLTLRQHALSEDLEHASGGKSAEPSIRSMVDAPMRREARLRASSSVNSRTFSTAMTAWSAKVWRRSTRPFGNGPSSNPETPGRHDQATEAEAAAKRLSVEVRPVEVRSPGELDDVFTALTRNGVPRCCTGQAQCSWSTGHALPNAR